MEKKKLVIFDFDGELVESLGVWYRMTQENNPGLNKQEYEAMSHGSYIDAFESKKLVYTEEGIRAYRQELYTIATPKPIVSFIEKNHSKYIFAVVSSGNENTIKNFLAKEGLEMYFSNVLGSETHKSKTNKLNDLLRIHSGTKSNVIFVTDTLGDILEANEAGVKSIGVLWGLHDRETLERGNPEIIIDDPALLEETIEKVLNE